MNEPIFTNDWSLAEELKLLGGIGRLGIGNWGEISKILGKGKFEWTDGSIYEGEYKMDKKNGFGIFKWPDGRIYKGNWKEGKQDGDGEFFSPKIKKWKKGKWEKGKRIVWYN